MPEHRKCQGQAVPVTCEYVCADIDDIELVVAGSSGITMGIRQAFGHAKGASHSKSKAMSMISLALSAHVDRLAQRAAR